MAFQPSLPPVWCPSMPPPSVSLGVLGLSPLVMPAIDSKAHFTVLLQLQAMAAAALKLLCSHVAA